VAPLRAEIQRLRSELDSAIAAGSSSLASPAGGRSDGSDTIRVHSSSNAQLPPSQSAGPASLSVLTPGTPGRPPPAARAPPPARDGTDAVLGPSAERLFGSMRFDGVVNVAALELQSALAQRGRTLEIINMVGGGDIDQAVQAGILRCDTFLVFGSAKYGENTGNAACTYFESKFAQTQKKRIILIRMIPFDAEFQFDQGKFMFGLNKLELPWMLGTPLPPDLADKIVEAMAEPLETAAARGPAGPGMAPVLFTKKHNDLNIEEGNLVYKQQNKQRDSTALCAELPMSSGVHYAEFTVVRAITDKMLVGVSRFYEPSAYGAAGSAADTDTAWAYRINDGGLR
jgi:hypothetical protein